MVVISQILLIVRSMQRLQGKQWEWRRVFYKSPVQVLLVQLENPPN